MPFQKFAKLQRTKTLFLFNLKLSKYDQKDFDKIKISNNLKINIEKIFSNFNENINSNTKVFIAHLPLKNKYIDRNYNDQFKKLTKLYAKKFNFKFIDLEKSYPKEQTNYFYSKNFGHHNELGYEIMSKYIASIIKEKLITQLNVYFLTRNN